MGSHLSKKDKDLLAKVVAVETFNLLRAESRRSLAERDLDAETILAARDKGRRQYETYEAGR